MCNVRKFCVYRHIAPNGKMYVGITSVGNNRWHGGSGYNGQPYFRNAIKKYGWENFQHEILLDDLTKEQAMLAEKLFIAYWDLTNHDKGYNIAIGGNLSPMFGRHHNEKTKKYMSEKMHKKYANGGHPMTGSKLPIEQRHKMSLAKLGKPRSEETKIAISLGRKDKKPVKQIDMLTNNTIQIFESLHEAERKTGIKRQSISGCCHGKHKYAGGYYWSFVNDEQ